MLTERAVTCSEYIRKAPRLLLQSQGVFSHMKLRSELTLKSYFEGAGVTSTGAEVTGATGVVSGAVVVVVVVTSGAVSDTSDVFFELRM